MVRPIDDDSAHDDIERKMASAVRPLVYARLTAWNGRTISLLPRTNPVRDMKSWRLSRALAGSAL